MLSRPCLAFIKRFSQLFKSFLWWFSFRGANNKQLKHSVRVRNIPSKSAAKRALIELNCWRRRQWSALETWKFMRNGYFHTHLQNIPEDEMKILCNCSVWCEITFIDMRPVVVAVKHSETAVNLSTLFGSTMHLAAKSTTKLFANLASSDNVAAKSKAILFCRPANVAKFSLFFTSRQFFFVNSTSTLSSFAKIGVFSA